eukprot:g11064.t1
MVLVLKMVQDFVLQPDTESDLSTEEDARAEARQSAINETAAARLERFRVDVVSKNGAYLFAYLRHKATDKTEDSHRLFSGPVLVRRVLQPWAEKFAEKHPHYEDKKKRAQTVFDFGVRSTLAPQPEGIVEAFRALGLDLVSLKGMLDEIASKLMPENSTDAVFHLPQGDEIRETDANAFDASVVPRHLVTWRKTGFLLSLWNAIVRLMDVSTTQWTKDRNSGEMTANAAALLLLEDVPTRAVTNEDIPAAACIGVADLTRLRERVRSYVRAHSLALFEKVCQTAVHFRELASMAEDFLGIGTGYAVKEQQAALCAVYERKLWEAELKESGAEISALRFGRKYLDANSDPNVHHQTDEHRTNSDYTNRSSRDSSHDLVQGSRRISIRDFCLQRFRKRLDEWEPDQQCMTQVKQIFKRRAIRLARSTAEERQCEYFPYYLGPPTTVTYSGTSAPLKSGICYDVFILRQFASDDYLGIRFDEDQATLSSMTVECFLHSVRMFVAPAEHPDVYIERDPPRCKKPTGEPAAVAAHQGELKQTAPRTAASSLEIDRILQQASAALWVLPELFDFYDLFGSPGQAELQSKGGVVFRDLVEELLELVTAKHERFGVAGAGVSKRRWPAKTKDALCFGNSDLRTMYPFPHYMDFFEAKQFPMHLILDFLVAYVGCELSEITASEDMQPRFAFGHRVNGLGYKNVLILKKSGCDLGTAWIRKASAWGLGLAEGGKSEEVSRKEQHVQAQRDFENRLHAIFLRHVEQFFLGRMQLGPRGGDGSTLRGDEGGEVEVNEAEQVQGVGVGARKRDNQPTGVYPESETEAEKKVRLQELPKNMYSLTTVLLRDVLTEPSVIPGAVSQNNAHWIQMVKIVAARNLEAMGGRAIKSKAEIQEIKRYEFQNIFGLRGADVTSSSNSADKVEALIEDILARRRLPEPRTQSNTTKPMSPPIAIDQWNRLLTFIPAVLDRFLSDVNLTLRSRQDFQGLATCGGGEVAAGLLKLTSGAGKFLAKLHIGDIESGKPGAAVDSEAWRSILQHCPNLQDLNLEACHGADDSILDILNETCGQRSCCGCRGCNAKHGCGRRAAGLQERDVLGCDIVRWWDHDFEFNIDIFRCDLR